VLALLLFGSPDRAVRTGEAPQDGVGQRAASNVDRTVAGEGPVDADGVQRHAAAVDGPAVALTFDDGPDPRWTPKVLDLLHRYRVKATFCLVGQHVAAHPELVHRIAKEGHALCDHTWSHDEGLASRPTSVVQAELRRTYDAIAAASGGVTPKYYRAPAGRWSRTQLAEAKRLRLTPLGWTVDPADWRRPPAAAIANAVLHGVTPGAVVLLHDGYGNRATTVEALNTVLPGLVARRLSLVIP
jgi:peptidoglycan/xylan/chitin deacetylase (PgdA/CDA1 family)